MADPRSRERPRGWDALTGAERRVARFVAEGLTNGQVAERLFVSRHTVEAHLKSAFAKLRISSRVELATEVVRREGGSGPGDGLEIPEVREGDGRPPVERSLTGLDDGDPVRGRPDALEEP